MQSKFNCEYSHSHHVPLALISLISTLGERRRLFAVHVMSIGTRGMHDHFLHVGPQGMSTLQNKTNASFGLCSVPEASNPGSRNIEVLSNTAQTRYTKLPKPSSTELTSQEGIGTSYQVELKGVKIVGSP